MSRPYLQRGTAQFHRANLALFVVGLVTFAVLYGVQPLLSTFASAFHLTPAGASLAISITTGTLAVSLLVAGTASDVWGRGTVMKLSVASSAILAVLSAFSPSFPVLLMLHALEGVTLAGLPVAAMAYLSEEVHPESLGLAMGLYMGGNGIGGMLGRTLVAALSDALGCCGCGPSPPPRRLWRGTPWPPNPVRTPRSQPSTGDVGHRLLSRRVWSWIRG